MNATIQKMTLKHLDEVIDIERQLFPDPWSKNSFLYEILGNRLSLAVVLLLENKVIGYSIVWIIFEEFHIANIAIHPDYQQQGFGKYLLTEILKTADNSRANRGLEYAILEVRESNRIAINMYEKFGFKKISVRYNYYSSGENAIIMRKSLTHSHEETPQF